MVYSLFVVNGQNVQFNSIPFHLFVFQKKRGIHLLQSGENVYLFEPKQMSEEREQKAAKINAFEKQDQKYVWMVKAKQCFENTDFDGVGFHCSNEAPKNVGGKSA